MKRIVLAAVILAVALLTARAADNAPGRYDTAVHPLIIAAGEASEAQACGLRDPKWTSAVQGMIDLATMEIASRIWPNAHKGTVEGDSWVAAVARADNAIKTAKSAASNPTPEECRILLDSGWLTAIDRYVTGQ